MPDIKQIQVGGSTYDIVDQLAQDRLDEIVEFLAQNGNLSVQGNITSAGITATTINSKTVSYKDLVITDGSTTTTYKVLCGA